MTKLERQLEASIKYVAERKRQEAKETAMPGDIHDESVVAGRYLSTSLRAFVRACEVHIEEELRKLSPDTTTIALLCDAVRLAREHVRMAMSRNPDDVVREELIADMEPVYSAERDTRT